MRLHPLLLRADNFTPVARTPWGGRRILDRYKSEAPVMPDAAPTGLVGESWEISVEPDFPSRVEESGELLSDAIARDARGMLGDDASSGCALLVKLLDAAEHLSVQIHPPDDYAGLAPGESGKPESWYVLDRDEGAGLYLGLREGVTRERMAEALARAEDVSSLLFFVPVEPGDFFVIDAGTAHAIGAGVTLVEPQRVQPGRRGVTYRYWDWNRRYDAKGQPSPSGEPRALHVEHALAVTAWDAPREGALLARIRRRAGAPDLGASPGIDWLAGGESGLASTALEVARIAGTGRLAIPAARSIRGLTVVAGDIHLRGDGFTTHVARGRSAVVPAGLGAIEADLASAHAILASAPRA